MSSNVKVDKISPTTNCGTVTLGDSGDTISIPSGATLSVGGSVSGIEGIVSWDTTPKTSAFTAVAGNGYFVDTSSAAITVTLPASPSAGDLVGIKDYKLTADTNNITIARNGSKIQGITNNFIINTEGRSVTLIYVDATQGWLITGASQASDIVSPTFTAATGGTITTCGDFKIHTFTGPGTFCVSSISNTPANNQVSYMVVAGGGSGGSAPSTIRGAGGGGAGGFREDKSPLTPYTASPLEGAGPISVTATAFPITVGAGGTGSSTVGCNTNGSNSSFSTITSAGGGKAGGESPSAPVAAGSDGGSGGGGGTGNAAGPEGSGNTPPVNPAQGKDGGSGSPPAFNYSPANNASGGGGGGATALGTNGQAGPSQADGGPGGAGATTSISGSSTTYAGGGGGGTGSAGGTPGSGGSGGGGAGDDGPNGGGSAATANTGGGGGGAVASPSTGYSGGSGIVIIRYKFQ